VVRARGRREDDLLGVRCAPACRPHPAEPAAMCRSRRWRASSGGLRAGSNQPAGPQRARWETRQGRRTASP
jgi:hypothetical protein